MYCKTCENYWTVHSGIQNDVTLAKTLKRLESQSHPNYLNLHKQVESDIITGRKSLQWPFSYINEK
jgi:ribosomal protein L31